MFCQTQLYRFFVLYVVAEHAAPQLQKCEAQLCVTDGTGRDGTAQHRLPVVVFRATDVVRRDEMPGGVRLMAPRIAVHIVSRAAHRVDESG
jgi:hypothetical protein